VNPRLRSFALAMLPPLATFILFVVLWDASVVYFEVEPFQVPRPMAVVRAAMERKEQIGSGLFLTGSAAAMGFATSLVVGVLVAFLFSQSRVIQRSLYPYAIFFQTVPIIAVAPLIINWFGHDTRSIVIVSAIVSLFPIITNTTTGLTELDRNAVELFELNGATRIQKLFKLQLPNSVPYLIAGARTSSGLSVIGAIIGEFFAGFGQEKYGLGFLIFQTSSQLKIDAMFACIVASTLLGLLIFGAVSLVGSAVLLRWRSN